MTALGATTPDAPQAMSAEEISRNPEAAWDLISSFFSAQNIDQLVQHQVESYNDFVEHQIQKTIDMFNPVLVRSEHDYDKDSKKYRLEVSVSFDNFRIYLPQIHENTGATKIMLPQEARLRNFTYAANMAVDVNIKYVIRSGQNLESMQIMYNKLPQIQIGRLPIMLRSSICVLTQYKHVGTMQTGECSLDSGGYFIIHGAEKVCLAQERAAENQVSVFDTSKNNTRWGWTAEVKSVPEGKCISPKQIAMTVATKNNGFGLGLFLQIPRIRQPIPLFAVFRALGIESDQEICEMIVWDLREKENAPILEFLRASVVDGASHTTKEEAMEHAGTPRWGRSPSP